MITHKKDQSVFLGNFIEKSPKKQSHTANGGTLVKEDKWKHFTNISILYILHHLRPITTL